MIGWARHSPVLTQRASPDPMPLELHDADLLVHNKDIIQSLGPSRSPVQDAMAWDKCLVDFSGGGLVGPFYSFEYVCSLFGDHLPRLIRRFSILEQHGGSRDSKCQSHR